MKLKLLEIQLKERLRKFLITKSIFLYRSEATRDLCVLKDIHKKIISTHKGVLHIGAHEGKESRLYSDLGASVIWVEANPEKYEILSQNIKTFSNQKAMCILLGSTNKNKVKFNISSNNGLSSSIYNFGQESLSRNLSMTKSVLLESKRLDSCFSIETICSYPDWVIDMQGAELEVLKGAGELLKYCYSLEVEVTSGNLDMYEGGAKVHEVIDFLELNGFMTLGERKIASHYMLLFLRVR